MEGSPSPVKGSKKGVGAGLVPKFGVRLGMRLPPGMDVEGAFSECWTHEFYLQFIYFITGNDPFAISIPGAIPLASQQPHRVSLL